MSEPSALSGVRVVDFTHVMLGPCCTQLLGDFGADVIKVERPDSGDIMRRGSVAAADPAGPDNPVFLSLNRNKRSIALDLRKPEDLDAIRELLRTADVVVSNFRPGVMERLGLGYEQLAQINPRLIWASGSGFGSTGPYLHKGGQDMLAQAFAGLMERKASPDLPTSIYPTPLCDYAAGMHLAQGILLALLARERTGVGQKVEVALYDSALAMQMQEATMQLMRGRSLNWAEAPMTGVFGTADGEICIVAAFRDGAVERVSEALELDPPLGERGDFSSYEQLVAQRAQLDEIMRAQLATKPTAHWMERLEAQDFLCAPVRPLAEALADEQTRLNDMLVEFEHPSAGTVRTVNAPVHLSGTPAAVHRRAPRLGEHTDEVLAPLATAAEA